ncbi:MAG: serine/threonine protein kinase [Sphaerospermopsis sp. SIO1G2]|nr:serine/threonine protein kinase [Sphaerospermopsis sp. SIO1G1]NET72074.1 serine/threonine protein kinase [Sphaerospermopsis sp. SIO1G2]
MTVNNSPFASPENQELLANRYQLQKLIGKGGMGEVFLASDVLLGGTPVAIKFLSQTVNPSIEAKFNREALLSAALSQKSIHIVRAYDYGISRSGKAYYVMEYLSGQVLKELFPISLNIFLNLTRQICLGLHCAHQGVSMDGQIYQLVHRDIKPANIIVIPDPMLGQLVKILDFGIAKFLNSTGTLNTKGFHGTLPYCSPEQLEGEELDSRSDIYSLGVVMFEMLTGQKPWQPQNHHFGVWYKIHQFETPKAMTEANPYLQVPEEVNQLIMACLEKKPENRPQTMSDIIRALSKVNISTAAFPAVSRQHYSQNSNSHNSLKLGNYQNINEGYKKFFWPRNKPIKEIVFPQLIDINNVSKTSLWLMLSQPEIEKRDKPKIYNQFTFISTPHPMLLWLTVLHNHKLEPRWLPCYLDMKSTQNFDVVSALITNESYPLMFFSLESPHSCVKILANSISKTQKQKLKTWLKQSQMLSSSSDFLSSKHLLKQRYKQIQAQISARLHYNNKLV